MSKNIKSVIAVLFVMIFSALLTHCGSQVQFSNAPRTSCAGFTGCGSQYMPPPTEREKAVMSLGLLTKNTACLMCHMRVAGDISGFGTMTFREDSTGQILGNIYAADLKLQKWTSDTAGNTFLDTSFVDTTTAPSLVLSVLPELKDFNLVSDASGNLTIRPGEVHNRFDNISFLHGGNYFTLTDPDPVKRAVASSHIISNTFTQRPIIHESDFPLLDPSSCESTSVGYIITADGTKISSPVNSNLILVNGMQLNTPNVTSAADTYNNYDNSCPANKTLEIEGEVLIKGDLVLSGCIHGQGTIYTTGSIFVPDDIKMANSAFPYSFTTDAMTLQSEALSRLSKDMLSLGAGKFILIGPPNFNVVTNIEQDPVFRNNLSALTNLFNWLSNGTAAQNQTLYESAFLKRAASWVTKDGTNAVTNTRGAVSLVEANMYANLGVVSTLIGGANSNLVVNGSIMTPNLSLLTLGWSYQHYDPSNQLMSVNPFNGQGFDSSQINQDYRLKYSRLGFECHRIRSL